MGKVRLSFLSVAPKLSWPGYNRAHSHFSTICRCDKAWYITVRIMAIIPVQCAVSAHYRYTVSLNYRACSPPPPDLFVLGIFLYLGPNTVYYGTVQVPRAFWWAAQVQVMQCPYWGF